MSSTDQVKDSSVSLPRKLVPSLPEDWVTVVFDLFRTLLQFLKRERHEGMYEILDYDSTMELVDPEGETAVFKRRQRVKFLQDNVIAFED